LSISSSSSNFKYLSNFPLNEIDYLFRSNTAHIQLEANIITDIYSGFLCPGNEILKTTDISLHSASKTARASFQPDGNLVTYRDSPKTALWSSGTTNTGVKLKFQTDGNLVILNANGGIQWQSNSSCPADDYCVLKILNDGRLIIYTKTGVAKWTNTESNKISATNFQDGYAMCSPTPDNRLFLFNKSPKGPFTSDTISLPSNRITLLKEVPCQNTSISYFKLLSNSSSAWWEYNW